MTLRLSLGDAFKASLVPFPRLTSVSQDVVSNRESACQGLRVPGMASRVVSPKLAVQGLAFLLEAGPFLSSGMCKPGIQQERRLILEYPSEHMAKPWLAPSLLPVSQMLPHL